MNSGDSGSFTRLRYDNCDAKTYLKQSTSSLQYRMSMDAFEHQDKCVHNKDSFYHPFDKAIVDTESALKGLDRKASRCPENKYPKCKSSGGCLDTFDVNAPIVLAQEVCPVVRNNIKRVNGPGYKLNVDVVGSK
jgi:hypothetical protein